METIVWGTLQPIVNPASLIYFRNGNDLLLFVDEEEDPVISNSQAESILFTFDFPWLGGERIFKAQNLLTNPFSIVLWDSAKEFLHISVNLYSIHRSSASMNSEKSPLFIISLCFLISSSSSGVNVESINSSTASSMRSIFLLISLNSLRRSRSDTVSCIFGNMLTEVDKGYCFEYFSISSSFCRTNLPKSVRTYAFDPFGVSLSKTGSTRPRSINSFIRLVSDLLSPLATSRSSDHLFGCLSDLKSSKPLA